jgi:hypothetical protein
LQPEDKTLKILRKAGGEGQESPEHDHDDQRGPEVAEEQETAEGSDDNLEQQEQQIS